MDKYFKEIQEIYESVFRDLPPEHQDKYYDYLMGKISPILEKFDKISNQIYEISEELKFFDYSLLKTVFDNHIEDSETKFRKYKMFFGGVLSDLRNIAENISHENLKHEIMNTLTGQEL